MGIWNANAGAEQWPLGSLPPLPRELFGFMCRRAQDHRAPATHDRPIYWAGRDHALAFLRGTTSAWSSLDALRADTQAEATLSRKVRADNQAYTRLIVTLTNRGAIRRVSDAYPGHAAEYQLNVDVEAYRRGLPGPWELARAEGYAAATWPGI